MILATIAGVALIAIVLLDAFETVVLPRRVTRKFRLARLFYRTTWRPWAAMASLAHGRRRETLLSFFGPLSLLLLLTVWAIGLTLGFGVLQWSLRSPLRVQDGGVGFGTYLYFSGTNFFTLGLGDVAPAGSLGKFLAVLEAGMGFGFLALVLGYLPVLYQAFSRREVNISLLDARAGTPPTAAELLRRHDMDGGIEAMQSLLHEWERWAAELMESHLSYPVLAYFRSQHDNQSWLAALTAILDTSALVMAVDTGACSRQARLTFAITRHAVVDLSQIFAAAPRHSASKRLSDADWERLSKLLDVVPCSGPDRETSYRELVRLRAMYEPYVAALAEHLRVSLPPWVPALSKADNWQTSGWERAERAAVPLAPTVIDQERK